MTDPKMPFPYFGGKSQVAAAVWLALGDVRNYVEPFAGSCAVLLGRKHGLTGVFLDPPYDGTEYVYGTKVPVSQRVQEWCAAHGGDPKLRIVLAGRGTEHDPLGWQRVRWSARKGYANHEERTTEALWISPSCFVR